uniref:IMPACT family protein n=1 Tax=Marinicella sediminis TaxID=1792834 RepID=UPI000986E7D5
MIKKSLFMGVCFHCDKPTEFMSQLDQFADPAATHNCWAYKIGNEYRFNDDGEPSGTAGKPILAALDGSGFDHIGALVIRHYGGIKLGTGGLARAYGGTIARLLQAAPFTTHLPMTTLKLQADFQHSQMIFQLVAQLNGQIDDQTFSTRGATFVLRIPQQQVSAFTADIDNLTKGSGTLENI